MTTTASTARRLSPTSAVAAADERPTVRELDERTTDGITVRLLWRPGDPGVLLHVDDARTGVRFELDVPGHDARLAFHHPFAYAG